jgi:hypothetical protein
MVVRTTTVVSCITNQYKSKACHHDKPFLIKKNEALYPSNRT